MRQSTHRPILSVLFTLTAVLPVSSGCGGAVQGTAGQGGDELGLLANTAAASATLVDACAQLGQSCRSIGQGCQASVAYCASGTEAGICTALEASCAANPQACALSASRCGGKPAESGTPAPADPADPANPQDCLKGCGQAPPPGPLPEGPSGSAPDKQAGGGTAPVDPAICCPALGPCIASNGTDCAALAQACRYDLSGVAPGTVVAKVTALQQSMCAGTE